MRLKTGLLFVVLTTLFALTIVASPAADTIPAQIGDAEYWKMISDFSESGGSFQLVIITSNETSYQSVMPDLMRTAKPGGTSFCVGPEQNFI